MATVQNPEADYRDLWQTVTTLEQRVASLELRLDPDRGRVQTSPEIQGIEDDIVRITEELFPGKVSIGIMSDPEYPAESFPVVQAEATGETREIVARRMTWHQRIRELSPGLVLPISLAIRT